MASKVAEKVQHTPGPRAMSRKPWGNFNVGEISHVAKNMEAHTRPYVQAAYKAAKRRAAKSPVCAEAAATMKAALDAWPAGRFDSVCDAERAAIAKAEGK